MKKKNSKKNFKMGKEKNILNLKSICLNLKIQIIPSDNEGKNINEYYLKSINYK